MSCSLYRTPYCFPSNDIFIKMNRNMLIGSTLKVFVFTHVINAVGHLTPLVVQFYKEGSNVFKNKTEFQY